MASLVLGLDQSSWIKWAAEEMSQTLWIAVTWGVVSTTVVTGTMQEWSVHKVCCVCVCMALYISIHPVVTIIATSCLIVWHTLFQKFLYTIAEFGITIYLGSMVFTATLVAYLQFQFATTLIFGWKEERTVWRVEWRCASRESGEQCVITIGILEMQWLSADSLVTPQNVRGYWKHSSVLLLLLLTQSYSVRLFSHSFTQLRYTVIMSVCKIQQNTWQPTLLTKVHTLPTKVHAH